jgi:carbonic anhydrase/acetyltransferase-like protein (isoleucine patch superfamily)
MPLYAIDGIAPELPPGSDWFIAPNAILIGRVRLLKNASVWFGTVLRGDNDWIIIGENSNVQDNAVIHTDAGLPAILGSDVTVGHGAIVHSASVGDGAMIGMGATLLNGCKIGAGSVVGANALVGEGKEFAPGSLIVGAPARAIRTLTDDQRQALKGAADRYVANARRYRIGLERVDK